MACRLLVKHTENTNATGDVLGVFNDNHVFGKLESKLRFIEAGLTDWPLHFVIINISDAEKEQYEYLLGVDEDGVKLHRLAYPNEDSLFIQELSDFAEATVTSADIDAVVVQVGV
tara:strand:- start:889 stop:1233 length:345 start_codon:yes stop_codon:yes gene_type:complete